MSPPGERKTATWAVVAVCLLGLFWFAGNRRVSLIPAERAPLAAPLQMVDATSKRFALADYRGRVVLLSLWADWCPPCRREAPVLSSLQAELGSQGLSVVGLNADSLAPDSLAPLAKAWSVDYRVASASGGSLGSYQGRGSVPHHWFIDRAGRVRGEKAGAVSRRTLRAALQRLLDEGSDAAP